MTAFPSRLRRSRDERNPQQTLSAALLSGTGVLLAIAHVIHGLENLQAGVSLVGLALGAVFPAILASTIVGAGYWLWQSDMTKSQVRRVVVWFVAGILGMSLLAGTGILYERFHGVTLAHLPFVWGNISTGGGIVGLVIGWYDIQMRARASELRVFREAVEHSGHAIYITDADGTIEYVNPAYARQTGYESEEAIGKDPSIMKSGEHDNAFYQDLWGTIQAGEIWTGEIINQTKTGENYAVNQTIAPVTNERGDVERYVAINADISEQKRQQRELEQQRDDLAQLHQLTGTMWEVTQALASAMTESELQQQVCDALISTEFSDAAWVSTYDRRTETLTPANGAGVSVDDLETVSVVDPVGESEHHRVRETIECQTVTVSDGDERPPSPWGSDLDSDHAVATIPIVHDDLVYGTLSLCSTRERAFDSNEHDQLAELGDAIAHGIDAIRTRKLLHADQVVELGCRASDEADLFVDASIRGNCTLSLSGTVPLGGNQTLVYATLEEGSVEALREVTATRDDVERVRVIDDGDEATELTLVVEPGTLIAQRLADLGAQIDQAEATGGEITITAYLAPDQGVRSVVEEVQETFPTFELVAKRETDRDDDNRSLHDVLSERQRAALLAAYHAGYFQSPRESTAEEVASSLGIAGSTFHKHLRRAQKQLLDIVFDAHPQGLGTAQTRQLQI